MINYYKVLGLHRGCNSQDVRDAYRPLAAATHPDKVPGKEEAFMLYAKAKSVLVQHRNAYDRELDTLGTKCTRCSGSGSKTKAKSWGESSLVPCKECEGCGVVKLPKGE